MIKPRILIVEDEQLVSLDLRVRLSAMGYDVLACVTSGEAALQTSREAVPDLVLMDIRLKGDLDGIEAAHVLRRELGIPALFITAYTDDATLERAKVAEPYGYLVKPIQDNELRTAIELALYRRRAEAAEHEHRALADALYSTVSALNSTLDLDEVLDRILAGIERIVPHEAAAIMLVEGQAARIVRQRGFEGRCPPDWALGELVSFDDAPALREVMAGSAPLIIPPAADGAVRYPFSAVKWARSHVCAPVRFEGETIGFLNLLSTQAQFFTQEHLKPLLAFADQVAIAVRNAHLYQTVREQVHELELRNEELDAFSHTVAHDLLAPLQIVTGYADLFTTEYSDSLAPDVHEGLKQIALHSRKIAQIVNGLMSLARLHQLDPRSLKAVDTEPVVSDVVQRYNSRIQQAGIAIRVVPGLPPVLGEAIWIEEIFANLIDNAIKYMGSSGENPHITVRGYQRGAYARFEVQDSGVGIALEAQQRIFEMFTRLNSGAVSGSGLGLSIVRRIVSKLNGHVGVDSAPGRGSTFWFELPAAGTPAVQLQQQARAVTALAEHN
jgi:signal transduction histidine kinase